MWGDPVSVSRQPDLGDMVGSLPGHQNKASIAIMSHKLFWFPSAYKSYVYTTPCNSIV